MQSFNNNNNKFGIYDNNTNNCEIIVVFVFLAIVFVIGFFMSEFDVNFANDYDPNEESNNFLRILSSYENEPLEDDVIKYASNNDIEIKMTYMGDIDIVDELNNNADDYDAVWISNSMWLYMLNNSYLTSDSKSISVSPVVFGIKKSKAKSLGLIDKDVTNDDIVKLIQDKKISYVMSSVTRTNTGATAYLGFLNSLAGNPEVLSKEHLEDTKLQENLKTIFSGVERVSGDENYLKTMFLNSSDYDAVIADESALIDINKQLVSQNKEPLYLIYPTDGVAVNDSTLAFVSSNKDKEDAFLTIQKYLVSEDGQKLLAQNGRRTWNGGTSDSTDKSVFNPDWGIDTTKMLIITKYPSKNIINEALNLYVELLRKPTHVAFCLDYSGSMSGDGIKELEEAMEYILDESQTSKDRLQFSDKDLVTIIPFASGVKSSKTVSGIDSYSLISYVNENYASGSTALFPCVEEALKIVSTSSDDYTKVVIAMTDGEGNVGDFSDLNSYYSSHNLNIPIYSIEFGSASEKQLNQMATLSNGKVFDGKSGLLQAFKEVRGYN